MSWADRSFSCVVCSLSWKFVGKGSPCSICVAFAARKRTPKHALRSVQVTLERVDCTARRVLLDLFGMETKAGGFWPLANCIVPFDGLRLHFRKTALPVLAALGTLRRGRR